MSKITVTVSGPNRSGKTHVLAAINNMLNKHGMIDKLTITGVDDYAVAYGEKGARTVDTSLAELFPEMEIELVEYYSDRPAATEALTFGAALEQLQTGKAIVRASWPAGTFVFKIQGNNDFAKLQGYGFGELMGEPSFADALFQHTADNRLVAWTVTQEDVLAKDWMFQHSPV